MTSTHSLAVFGDVIATGMDKVITDAADLDEDGWWAVTQTFEGAFLGFRFAQVHPLTETTLEGFSHVGIDRSSWRSSMSEAEYMEAVSTIRDDISSGWVYQTNLCRLLSARLNHSFDSVGFLKLLRKHNPSPYLSALFVSATESGLPHDVRIACASPELFLRRTGNAILTSPIKGTAGTSEELLEKDRAENVMIVDLMRNDLAEVCIPGSVHVPELLRLEQHPGLVHLVSDVRGELESDTTWAHILERVMPPGSVSGAPKSSSLEVIRRLEPVARSTYCGIIGWLDQDANTAELAVGIRTFWQSEENGEPVLNFGTGAGITWGSDPAGEWQETELKARHLLTIAAMST
jgi:para-aminobenzoate synthetase component 1